MTTGSQFANIAPKRILSYEDLGLRVFDYLKEYVRTYASKAWLVGGVFGDTKATLAGSAQDTLKVTFAAPYLGGVDNSGHVLLPLDAAGMPDDTTGRIVEVPFENLNGVVYRVGYTYASIPRGIKSNPRNGIPEYAYFLDAIGTKGNPDAVVDNGNGTITFSINSVCDRYGFQHSYSGRICLVYLKVPSINANDAAVAIETCVVGWNGSANRITTVGNLGQNPTSLLSSDYEVVLLGPWISKNETNEGLDDMFIGRITGNGGTPPAGDVSGQNLINQSLSSLAANTYIGGPDWLDGTTNPLTQVNSQLSKIISDLSDTTGAAKLGAAARSAWPDGQTNPASSIFAAIEKIVSDLGSSTDGNDGSAKIGTEVSAGGLLTGTTVRAQLDQLESGVGVSKNLYGRPITDLSVDGQPGGQIFMFDGTSIVVGHDTAFISGQADLATLEISPWGNVRNIYWQGAAAQGSFNTIYGLNHPTNPAPLHIVHFINGGIGALKFALQNSQASVAANQFISRHNSVQNDYTLHSGCFIMLVSYYGSQWYLFPSGNATPGGA